MEIEKETTGFPQPVTVIVPVYRVEKYVEQCINSVVNQTYRNLEIILVDDGTDDSCSVICDRWASKDSRIIVIHKSNGGLSDARNAGLSLLRGEYVAFVDSDDWIDSTYIEKLRSVAIREQADVVTCALVVEYENTGKAVAENRQFFSGESEQALTMLYDQTKIGVNAFRLYKSWIWENLRFPYGKLYEDLLTVYRIFDLANRIVQISDGLYHYRVRDNSIMTAPFSLKIVGISDAWKENYLFCQKNYPSVAPMARMFWLETIPGIIRQFPSELTHEEKREKRKLKREIVKNSWFIIGNMPLKKIYYLARAVCLL